MKNYMTKYSATIFLLTLFLNTQLHAQFESKSSKKLYNKLDEAYLNYDYETILNEEESIKEKFSSFSDTVSFNANTFLAEAYMFYYGDLEASLDLYTKVLKGMESAGTDFEDRKNTLYNIANANDQLGYYNKSEEIYIQIMESDAKSFGKDSPEYIETALSLAVNYGLSNKNSKGIKLLKSIQQYISKDEETYPRLMALYGSLYRANGSYNQAERHLNRSLSAFERLGLNPSVDYIGALNNMYDLYMDMGRYPDAEEVLLESIDMSDRMEGDMSDINSLLYHNIAEVYRIMGNYDKAERFIKQSIDIQIEYGGEESLLVAQDMMVLASIYDNSGRYKESEETHKKTIAITEASLGKEDMLYHNQKSNLANVYRKTGRLDLALQLTREATNGFEKNLGNKHYRYAYSLFRLGETYQLLGDLKNAEENLSKSLKIRRNVLGKYHPDYAVGTRQMAILKWDQDETEEVVSYFDETFDNYFAQINAYFPTLSEEEKAKFYNNKIKVSFEQFNSFAVQNAEKNPELKSNMYDFQLATKGLIMYATNKVRESIVNSGDSVLMAKYELWISQKEQLSRLFSSHEGDVTERNNRIDSLLEASNNLEKELGKESAVFAENMSKQKVTWRDVQKKLKEGEAAVEMIRYREFLPDSAGSFTDNVNYAALIIKHDTKDHPEMVVLDQGAKMESRYLANYRNGIRYKVNEDYSYRLFWKPISEKLGDTKKVYFSPDGVYNQISIYTLRNSETKKFLVDEIDMQVLTNTKDLVTFNYDDRSYFDESKAYLFGFPNYNMGSIEENDGDVAKAAESIATAVSQGRGRGVSRGARGTRGDRGSGNSRGGGLSRGVRGNLQRYSGNNLLALLPGTKREVELIQNLYSNQKFQPEVFMANAAIEEEIKVVNSPQTLHIATHGFFLENDEPSEGDTVDEYVENPLLRSGLIFAGANSFLSTGVINIDSTAEEDGILTAYEAMNMNLDDTELVVLSACETGLGEVSNGEGVYGLQRAFQIAGAESIIMSMWTVDDDATQELMTTFYEKWMETGDKQLAFNTAQKAIKEKWKAPYYWGAFVMVGL